MERSTKSVIIWLLVGALWPAAMPMGETVESTSEIANFIPLADEETSYDGYIIDEIGTPREQKTYLTEISFGGSTTLSGLRAKGDDSNTGIDLEKIKSLRVLPNETPGEEYRGKDLFSVSVTDNLKEGTHTLLFPAKVTICGIEKDSGFTKAWLLRLIDEVHITGKTPPATLPPVKSSSKVALLNKKVARKG